MKSNHLWPAVALATVIIIWSIAPILVRSFALATGPSESIVIRMWTNAIFCLPILFYVGSHIDREDWGRLALVSMVGNFGYFVGSIYGFAHLSAGAGGVIYATSPLLIALLSIAVGMEKISPAVIAGLVISFLGTIYLFADGFGGNSDRPIFGGLLLLFGCASWAIYVVYNKPLVLKYGPTKITLWSNTLSALPALAFVSPHTLDTALTLNRDAIIALLLLSLVGTIFSVNLWNFALANLPPTSVGAALYLIPPGVAFFGWVLLGEAMGLKTLIGGVIILLGVAVAEFGKSFFSAKAPA